MKILWVLFLFILDFVSPVVAVIAAVWGIWTLWKLSREIKSIRAARGDTAAMELEMTRYKAKFAGILSVVLGIAAIIGAIALGVADEYAALFVGAVVFFPLVSWSAQLKARYKKDFKQNYVAAELSKVFNNLKYDHTGGFPGGEIADLGLFAHTDSIGSSDLIEADYKGTRFAQSDLHVQEVWTETETDDGSTREVTRRRDVFKGRVMKFDFLDTFKGEVRVTSKDFGDTRTLGAEWRKIETELAEFGDRFNVYSLDPVAAMTVLTPQMIEGVYWLESAVNVPVAFYFKGNAMYAFLTLGYDAFEATGKTLLEAKTQLTHDIKLVTDFMETMYFKRQGGEDAAVPIGAVPFPRRRETPERSVTLEVSRKVKRASFLVFANIGRAIFALYLASAVYTLVKLPGGIVLSTDVTNPEAVTAPTLGYLAVLTVFMLPLLSRRLRFKGIVVNGILFLLHWWFVSANIGG
ncbi:MAG: DUF3137 domain-containing protein [Synergistaceae bacterium]|jgi:hypothetical protein|nr:DUF3137 domain-containing protein [Synergistaceae bacterium]